MLKTVSLLMLAFLLLSGCSGMNPTEQRVLSGGAIGAAAGSAATGAAIGGGAGLLGGFLYDQYQKSQGRP